MVTFCRSKGALDSYSMLTYDSEPLRDGQQLMVSGTTLSSLLCKAHKGAKR